MLYEEQRRGNGGGGLAAAHDVGIEQGLQVVVAVVVDAGGVEDGIQVGQGLEVAAARLVVDDADAAVGQAVQTVDATANL